MTREEQIGLFIKKSVEGIEDSDTRTAAAITLAAGIHWAYQHPQWIPVEEHPTVDMSCTLLVHYVDGTIDICDYYGDFYDYTGENVTRNVTHWMPLPQAPRKEENHA